MFQENMFCLQLYKLHCNSIGYSVLARYVTNGYKTLPHIGQHCPGGTVVVAPAAQSGRAHLTTCRFDSNMYMYTYVYMYACMCVCIYVCYVRMYAYNM